MDHRKRAADIVPQNGLDLRHLIETETDADRRRTLEGAAENCRTHGSHWQWYAPWLAYDHATGEQMGLLYFDGAPKDGVASLTLEFTEPWRGSQSAGGALSAALEWAFKYGEVYVVRVRAVDQETRGMVALRSAPEKNGWYELKKPRTPWIPAWLVMGLLLGAVGGKAVGRPALGAVIGALIGGAVGAVFSLREKRRRAAVMQKLS
ncbi:MAG: hypothetical protein IIZ26_01315 [Oscillospiraceae bacterium]|nr:hypothetical protein [Oscillospiraceae bacterium]